jgi:F-type H+-transporting ATPase subunit b
VLKARTELRGEAARLAVELAEKSIKEKIVKDDQDRLVGEYLTKVVELH